MNIIQQGILMGFGTVCTIALLFFLAYLAIKQIVRLYRNHKNPWKLS